MKTEKNERELFLSPLSSNLLISLQVKSDQFTSPWVESIQNRSIQLCINIHQIQIKQEVFYVRMCS
jgi:hypothetical protein